MAKKIIELKNIKKSYDDNVILEDFNLYINENEFITLLGPSGCGKTTTLRLIGGFEAPDSGDIILDGVKINDIPPYQRPINTVFQKYALFPHLNVFDNVAFGLRNFNRTVADIKANVARKYEADRKNIQAKLNQKGISNEEKAELKAELKELKAKIKAEVIEVKDNLIEERINQVEEKYEHIFKEIEDLIEIEDQKDDEVREAKLELKELNEKLNDLIKDNQSKSKEYKKLEQKAKELQKIVNWEEYDKLVARKKEEAKNYALELKSAKSLMLNKKQIAARVSEALKLVKLEGFEDRKIDNMSGGQQQRVAIARAIVNKPRILLLDEPLAALDLKLRQAMQYELKEMQKKLGITFIFVTHDQEEALTMSDTIVVMNGGNIEQIGTPEDIYNEPKNRYVANFIGESNIVRGTYLGNKTVNFMGHDFECVDANFSENEVVDVVIRPEDFDIVPLEEAKLIGTVENVIFKGIHFEITAKVQNETFIIRKYELFHKGDKIGLSVDPYEIHLMKVYE